MHWTHYDYGRRPNIVGSEILHAWNGEPYKYGMPFALSALMTRSVLCVEGFTFLRMQWCIEHTDNPETAIPAISKLIHDTGSGMELFRAAQAIRSAHIKTSIVLMAMDHSHI